MTFFMPTSLWLIEEDGHGITTVNLGPMGASPCMKTQKDWFQIGKHLCHRQEKTTYIFLFLEAFELLST